jgi:hypothetical protein
MGRAGRGPTRDSALQEHSPARVHFSMCVSQRLYISACVHLSMLCHILLTSVLTSAALRKISGPAHTQQPSPAGHAPASHDVDILV